MCAPMLSHVIMMPGKELHEFGEVLEPNLVNVSDDFISDDSVFLGHIQEVFIKILQKEIMNFRRIRDEGTVDCVDHSHKE